MTAWHSMEVRQVLAELQTREDTGLNREEAERRQTEYGPNRLAQAKQQSLPARILGQLKDPMILILLAAALLSLVAGGGEDWTDALIILLIVAVNAWISLSQEDSARKALEALNRLSAPRARVIRNGETARLEAELLVPGDIILLEAGDYVPADGRLISAAGLKADESAMTGESLPVNKTSEEVFSPKTGVADRKNMVIASTLITGGRGTAVVTATGMDTEMGRIAGMLMGQEEGKTPLQRKMTEISKTLSFLCLAVCAVMFGAGLLQHKNILDMFLTAVSLAVAAIPEGLPAIVTIVMALGVQRMAKYNAIVKKLPAVETLGCASVICSDKTGTLTRNRMTITETFPREKDTRQEILTLGTLCGDVRLARPEGGEPVFAGDPTEIAFVEEAFREGVDKIKLESRFPRRGEVPFDSVRKRMSTLHARPGGGWRLAVKGAPEAVLPRCTGIAAGGGVIPMTRGERAKYAAVNDEMAGRALRVLAVAYRDLDRFPLALTAENLERDLTFVGLAGMMDPPRAEVKEAVSQCFSAGIRPVMITGDHQKTAVAIAREIGIYREGDLAIDGEKLEFLPKEILEEEIDQFSVFARVTPEHKLRIVEAWQKKGKIVAMTGDGVNDAPALKKADIGCAMGKSGTDVAKEAAEMILTDDNFTAIVQAVEQGRGIYANIKKAIHYLLSCNIGEIITVFAATVLGFRQMPLTPVQLLWLNLVTDSLPALALGMEPVEHDVMRHKPRDAKESLFSKAFSFRLAWQGLMVGGLTLAAYWLGEYILGKPGTAHATANTMAFATLTLCQLFHAFDVRSEEQSLFHIGIFSNSVMNKSFIAGVSLQMAVLCLPPLQKMFSVVPLDREEWRAVLLLAIAPLFICEAEKAIRRRRKQARKDKNENINLKGTFAEARHL